MDRFQYLLLMAACVALTLPLEFVFSLRVYRRPQRLLAAIALPVLAFAAWDAIAIARGHWQFSPRFTTGWTLPPFGLPVEEIAFFVSIPLCTLLTFESVKHLLAVGVTPFHRGGGKRSPKPVSPGARDA